MAQCQKKECNVSKKRERLINDFQELIDCMQIGPSEKPVAGQITVHKQLVCVPCPAGDGNKNSRSKIECGVDQWKKDRYKSRELKGGILLTGCDCLKRNGLQHDCQRTDCMGRPPCLLKPWPDCIPSGGTGLRGAEPRVSKYPYRPAPCPPPDFPLGYEEDHCHKAEVDCKKCDPVLMCRPGEVWECIEGKCPPNPPSNYTYLDAQPQYNSQSQQQQCPLGKMMQLQDCPLQSQCPNARMPQTQERLPTNVLGQEIICQRNPDTLLRERQQSIGCPGKEPQRDTDVRERQRSNGCPGREPHPDTLLLERQRSIGCPNKEPHQRPGYEQPQRLCRPGDPQPIQQTVHSSARGGNGSCPMMGSGRHCDPPTHVLKRPAYQAQPPAPVSNECSMQCSMQYSTSCPEQSCPEPRQIVPDKTIRPKPTFEPAVYRKPPRSTVDDWMCQLPCDEKEPPICVQCHGEACYWHRVIPPLKRFTAADLNGQW